MSKKSWALSVACLLLLPNVVEGAPNRERLARNCNQGKQKDCAQLATLARTDVKATALLTDAAVLADIAANGLLSHAQVAALSNEHLNDPQLFASIARSGSYSSSRLKALDRITDQHLLDELARDSANVEVRLAAIARVSDQTLLTAIALDEKAKADVTLAAVNKLDFDHLMEVMARGRDYSAATGRAAGRIKETLPDLPAEQVAQVALIGGATHATSDLRRVAIASLTDQAALAEIVLKHSDAVSRARAFDRLSEPEMLIRVASSAPWAPDRVTALRRLSKPDPKVSNLVLIHAVEQKDWDSLTLLVDLGFTPSASAKKALNGAAKGSGYGASVARAFLAGLKTKSWPRLRVEPYIQLRKSDGASIGKVLPPGWHFLSAGYKDSEMESMLDTVVQGDLKAGRCYVLVSGKSSGYPRTWKPKINEEPCPKDE